MTREAPTVFTAPQDIERLQRHVTELAVNARVRLRLDDGAEVEGLVTVTPTVQSFRDEHEHEGMNGVVHIEDADGGTWQRTVWLSDIRDIHHVDSVTPGSSRA